jgi:hypothetical protein
VKPHVIELSIDADAEYSDDDCAAGGGGGCDDVDGNDLLSF